MARTPDWSSLFFDLSGTASRNDFLLGCVVLAAFALGLLTVADAIGGRVAPLVTVLGLGCASTVLLAKRLRHAGLPWVLALAPGLAMATVWGQPHGEPVVFLVLAVLVGSLALGSIVAAVVLPVGSGRTRTRSA